MPYQEPAAIRLSSGNMAASVLPPAVGASSSASPPPSRGRIAACCQARNPGHCSVLTMWCSTTGCSSSASGAFTARRRPADRRRPGALLVVQVQGDVAGRGGVAFDVRELGGGDHQRVVAARVEGRMVVDAIEDVDEFLQIQPRGDADPAGDRVGEGREVAVVDGRGESAGFPGAGGVDVADPAAELDEGVVAESGQTKLDRPGIVEPGVAGEVRRQPLRERRQALHALRAVVERRGAGDAQVQAGKATAVNLVDELAQRVEGLVPGVGANPLQGFDLVEDEQQPRIAAVAQHDEQPLQEAQGAEMVEVAADAGDSASGGRDVWLAGEPGQHGLRGGLVTRDRGAAIAAQRRGEGGGAAGDLDETLVEQVGDGPLQRGRVGRVGRPSDENVLLQRVEPGIDDGAQRARRERRGAQAFGEAPVDGLQPVQRRLVLGDLHLGGGQVHPAGPVGEPAGEEPLAGAVLPAHRLEHRAAGGHRGQVVADGGLEPAETDGEQIEPGFGDHAAAQRVEDLAAPGRAHLCRGVHPRRPNCSRSRVCSRRSVRPLSISASTG